MKKIIALLLFALGIQCLPAQEVISITLKGQRTKSQLVSQFGLPFIQFGAKFYNVVYTSRNVKNQPDTVTGLLTVPDVPSRIYPRAVYQHGTSGTKQSVPSLTATGGEGQVGLMLAGLGYISHLPDYLGLGNVSKGFHPYVHADSEAWVAEDMLTAVEKWLVQNNVSFNQQLFITGYSQGGHSAMALHRAIEKNPASPFKVTAAAPLSGPYSIGEVMRELILTDKVYMFPAYIPNTALSYQTVYGNLYSQLTDLFKPEYAGLIQDYYDNKITLSALNDNLVAKLIAVEGESRPIRMIQSAMLDEIKNNPDHPINKALKANNTYNNWIPKAPIRLFYCMNDDQVPFMNSIVAHDSLKAAGAVDIARADVLSTGDHGACYTPAMTNALLFFGGMQQIGTVSGDEEQVVELRPFVFPNPATDFFTVEVRGSEGFAELFNAEGALVSRRYLLQGMHRFETNILPAGQYFVRLTDEGVTRTQVLVIR